MKKEESIALRISKIVDTYLPIKTQFNVIVNTQQRERMANEIRDLVLNSTPLN